MAPMQFIKLLTTGVCEGVFKSLNFFEIVFVLLLR